MEKCQFTTGDLCLQFFGKINASISHEIKNSLAIVNENAGLLEDLSLMALKGKNLEPERITNLAENILKQVRRTDDIIKRMNQFAHSTDEPLKQIDIIKILKLLLSLTDRFAAMRGVKVQLESDNAPINMFTSPFPLMNLIWLCLDFAMGKAGEKKSICLTVTNNENGVNISFTGLDNLTKQCVEDVNIIDIDQKKLKLLSKELNAKFSVFTQKYKAVIILNQPMIQ